MQALCFCAVVTGTPAPQMSQHSWDISYTHELVDRRTHLLRLSVTDYLIVGSNHSRTDRLHDFAEHFAADTCQGHYRLADADRQNWRVRPVYAKQFVFTCTKG